MLHPYVVVRHRIARHGVVGTFDHNPEAVAVRGLLITRYRIIPDDYTRRNIDVIVTDNITPPKNGDTGNVAVIDDDCRARNGIVFHHDAAITRSQARTVGHFYFDTEPAIIGHYVIGNHVGTHPAHQAD